MKKLLFLSMLLLISAVSVAQSNNIRFIKDQYIGLDAVGRKTYNLTVVQGKDTSRLNRITERVYQKIKEEGPVYLYATYCPKYGDIMICLSDKEFQIGTWHTIEGDYMRVLSIYYKQPKS